MKHETATGAHSPGLGTFKHPCKKSQYRYKPYDIKDSKQSRYATSQSQHTYGISFLTGAGAKDVVVGVPAPLPTSRVHMVASSTNDNYCPDPQVQLSVIQMV